MSSATISLSTNTSILSIEVLSRLQEAFEKGVPDGKLVLTYRIEDKMIPELCEWIRKLEGKVKILDLQANKITSRGASLLFNALKDMNSTIPKIQLNGNLLTDDCMQALGEYIQANKNIEGVGIGNNRITQRGIEILAPYLDGNTTFKYLPLFGNAAFRTASIPIFTKMIESSRIESMDLDLHAIGQDNSIAIPLAQNALKYGSYVLNLCALAINEAGMVHICDLIRKYGAKNLNEVILVNNKITSKGIIMFLELLTEFDVAVTSLNFTQNPLDDACAITLGEYIQDNQHLQHLLIGLTELTDKGMETLSQYLIGNTTLKELSLIGNRRITEKSGPCIVDVVRKSCIANIDCTYTSLPSKESRDIEAALKVPIEQREVPIKSNSKSAAKIS